MDKTFKRVEARLHLIDDRDIIEYLNSSKESNSRLVKRAIRNYINTDFDNKEPYIAPKYSINYKKDIVNDAENNKDELNEVSKSKIKEKDTNTKSKDIIGKEDKIKEVKKEITNESNIKKNILEDDDDGFLTNLINGGKKL